MCVKLPLSVEGFGVATFPSERHPVRELSNWNFWEVHVKFILKSSTSLFKRHQNTRPWMFIRLLIFSNFLFTFCLCFLTSITSIPPIVRWKVCTICMRFSSAAKLITYGGECFTGGFNDSVITESISQHVQKRMPFNNRPEFKKILLEILLEVAWGCKRVAGLEKTYQAAFLIWKYQFWGDFEPSWSQGMRRLTEKTYHH